MPRRTNGRESRDDRAAAGRRRPLRFALGAALAALLLATVLTAVVSAGGGREEPVSVASASASATPSPSPSASPVPTWRLESYRRVGFDKSFKADLIDELPATPELVVFGGSRAMRFEPSYFASLTGLSTFNCAVQCFRPEDAWAFSSYLYAKSPDARIRCVIALQARTFRDDRMRPGLLHDERLAAAFPKALVARQRAALGKPEVREVLGVNRYRARGYLVRNRYDVARARPNYSFKRHIDISIERLLPNHSWSGPLPDTRSRRYFEKTVRLYNEHGVEPLIVLMPHQPRALRAFREAGFQKHLDRLAAYLRDAGTRCRFRVLDLTDIHAFGGSAREFYDAVHVTRENAHRMAGYAVRTAPECFR